MEKGKIIATILETLEDEAINFTALTLAMITSGYSPSLKKVNYNQRKIRKSIIDLITPNEEENKIKRRLSSYLSTLKRQGFINNDGNLLSITKKGIDKLKNIRNLKAASFPTARYTKTNTGTWTLAAFDVPEEERRKRNWLRSALTNLGFTNIQKSFFVGRVKIPEEFITDLNRLNLLPYIEIFEITKKGTLEKTIT